MGFIGHLDAREFIFQEAHAPASFIRLGKRFGGRAEFGGSINGWLQQFGAVEKYTTQTHQTRVFTMRFGDERVEEGELVTAEGQD